MNASLLLTAALSLLMNSGEAAVTRAFTPSEKWVRSVCARTGANPEEAIQERNEQAVLWVEFVKELADLDDDGHTLAFGTSKPATISQLQGLSLNVMDLAVMLYRAFGRGFLVRALTVPRNVLEKIVQKTGADILEVIEARDMAAQALVEFIESLVDKDFEPQPN
jgi:hypothetical protein